MKVLPLLLLAGMLCVVLGCSSSARHADYVGNPVDMNNACVRAATVCSKGDDWIACRNDLDECHRLGLWYEDGIKVGRDPARARAVFESMCDRFEMSSCNKLCKLAPDGLLRNEPASPGPDGKVPLPPYAFEQTRGPVRAIPRPPPRAQRHVGEGLWSGWKTVHNTEGGSFGVMPVLTRTVGSGHRATHASVLAGFISEIYMRSWYPGQDKYLRFVSVHSERSPPPAPR
jgi:hypothetical protein